ncbi:MAG: HIT family protein [Chloroflexota bacterium]
MNAAVERQADCYSCQSLAGERQISPGPTIYVGEHWVVEHVYPCQMAGWLVIVLKRHKAALHELTTEEFVELGTLLEQTSKALRENTGCKKEYVVCFAEAEHFEHVHFHVISRIGDIADEFKGPHVFRLLQAPEQGQQAATAERIAQFCEQLRDYMRDDR